MIDIVYILGTGSIWQNNELRFSLRSVEKHLKGFGNVWIIGEKADFLEGVNHIKMSDPSHCKETNIKEKIIRACREKNISDSFLFFNDDHFLNKDFIADAFPYYHSDKLSEAVSNRNRKDQYSWALQNTFNVLMNNGLQISNFDVHYPIVYNKDKFILSMNKYDWSSFPYYDYGFVVKSLYCNTVGIEAKDEFKIEDAKISKALQEPELIKRISDKHVWSISDKAISPELFRFLKKLYPQKSRWEKS